MTPTPTIRRGWLHEDYPNLLYRWVVKNRLMRSDELGIEITYRPRHPADTICGARTIHPGLDGWKGYGWRTDQSMPHEVVCTFVGDHAETPHIGVPAECADLQCRCADFGSYHLVIVGFAIRPDRPSVAPGVAADQGVWGPNESEEP